MGEPTPPQKNSSSPVQEVPSQSAWVPLRSLLDDLPANITPLSALPPRNREKRLHVSNIPFKWRETELQALFGAFGEVKDVSVVTNERGSKGYGFISFLNEDAADKAIAALDGRDVGGRAIQVSSAICRRMIPKKTTARNTSNGNEHEQYSADLGVLLLKQKQMLAQQQQLQLLIAQQQSDLIANALGLSTPNLGGLLTGSLQYPATAALPGLNMDAYALQLQQQLQTLPLLQQMQQQTALSTQQQYPAYSQSPAVAAAYALSQSYGATKSEIGPHQPFDQTLAMYTSSENSLSSSSLHKNRSRSDVTSHRFNPY